MAGYTRRLWLEEDLSDDSSWKHRVTSVLYSGQSRFQQIDFMDTPQWGKVLLLDGKMQSTEADELFYHELLVHPALLHHPNPKRVFIMGGGEGATAREVLRHKSVEQVVMVDIDKVVTDFCAQHLHRNKMAFADPRLTLINDDARSQLESWPGTFDVIIGDLADPLDGGPCYQLYTQEFYKSVIARKLAPGGVFITQSGPAGFLSAKEVFSTIHCTAASVFARTVPFAQHIPSFCDCWGFTLAFSDPGTRKLTAEEFDHAAATRIRGELVHMDGSTWQGVTLLNKQVRLALEEETEVYTRDNARFIHGHGANTAAAAPAAAAPVQKHAEPAAANGHANGVANGSNGYAMANGHAAPTANGHHHLTECRA